MTDLKLLDELLVSYAQVWDRTPRQLEYPYGDSLTRAVMQRLRTAYQSGEMRVITLAWAQYFDQHREAPTTGDE